VNPLLDALQPYPFERLATLKAGLAGNPAYDHVALSIGEPRHPPPDFAVEALADAAAQATSLGAYPATRGLGELREAIAAWLARRFGAAVDPESQILPVMGTREALFSFGQAVLSGRPGSVAVLPDPFYQIYEGAALLRGATPVFVPCTAATDYQPDFDAVAASEWQRCELVYLCSPGNPTGRVLPADRYRQLLELADRHDFVIAADECYSEIYLDEATPPTGLLAVAAASGRDDFSRCVVFHSLSKRSNLPGLRSGFVAGDATILARYLAYRTYAGCAMPQLQQRVSAAAWADEAHVRQNRALYREKFAAVEPLLRSVFDLRTPEAGFYHWLPVPGGDDEDFTRRLFVEANITVLPGRYLGRPVAGTNPGEGHVRVAWVAPPADCLAAAERMVGWAGAAAR